MKSEGHLLKEFLLLRGDQSIVVFRTSAFSTHMMKLNLLYTKSTNLNVNLSHKILSQERLELYLD